VKIKTCDISKNSAFDEFEAMFTIRVKGLLLPWWKWRQIS
jgi:hypothetical protein